MRVQNVQDMTVVLFGVDGPQYLNTIRGCRLLKMCQVSIEVGQNVILYCRCRVTQFFPFRNLAHGDITLFTYEPERVVVPFRTWPVGKKCRGTLGVGFPGISGHLQSKLFLHPERGRYKPTDRTNKHQGLVLIHVQNLRKDKKRGNDRHCQKLERYKLQRRGFHSFFLLNSSLLNQPARYDVQYDGDKPPRQPDKENFDAKTQVQPKANQQRQDPRGRSSRIKPQAGTFSILFLKS